MPQPEEQRACPRAPSASSFVPGLVHELRNFIFGLSGSLDAMEARFGQLEGAAKYQTVMRASLDRLGAFVDELGDYGEPRAMAWACGNLEPVLREVVEQHRPGAVEAGIELALEFAGPLPPLRMDARGLGTAFSRLLKLALGQQARCGRVTLFAGPGILEDRPVIRGYLDSSGLDLPGVDLARLFEPFYYRAAGFGRLALPVARRVLEHHGGSLTAAPSPGGGVRLAFTLPA
jgi:signal transduction histidine kinase